MPVQAKFFVSAVKRTDGSSTADQVTLGAVCRGVENALWSQATPAGQITLSILNEAATDQFIPGEEYLVTFTRVDKPVPGDGHAPKPVRHPKWNNWLCETCGGTPSYDARTHPDPRTLAVDELDWSVHQQVYGG